MNRGKLWEKQKCVSKEENMKEFLLLVLFWRRDKDSFSYKRIDRLNKIASVYYLYKCLFISTKQFNKFNRIPEGN